MIICVEDKIYWYVAYGSNMDVERLRKYFKANRLSAQHRSVPTRVPYELYFAGRSRTWGGGVAFLGLLRGQSCGTEAIAHAVSGSELAQIFRGENGLGSIPSDPTMFDLQPHKWVRVLMPEPADGMKGKYNAILRLDDIEGRPAFTVTTCRDLEKSQPTEEYGNLIVGALSKRMGIGPATVYVQSVRAGSASSGSVLDIDSYAGAMWVGPARPGKTTGMPSLRLPAALAPQADLRLFLGRLRSGPGAAASEVWTSFDLDPDATAEVTPQVARDLKLTGEGELLVRLHPDFSPRRISGWLADIPMGDVVQVHSDSQHLGPWALAVTRNFSGPVRVCRAPHVPIGAIRVPYAARRLLGIARNDQAFSLQTIPVSKRSVGGWVKGMAFRLGERALGAPVVPLRAYEGLVGDDGRRVIRVDPTALDYLGVRSGDYVIVSWADRALTVRVLLQTPETLTSM